MDQILEDNITPSNVILGLRIKAAKQNMPDRFHWNTGVHTFQNIFFEQNKQWQWLCIPDSIIALGINNSLFNPKRK